MSTTEGAVAPYGAILIRPLSAHWVRIFIRKQNAGLLIVCLSISDTHCHCYTAWNPRICPRIQRTRIDAILKEGTAVTSDCPPCVHGVCFLGDSSPLRWWLDWCAYIRLQTASYVDTYFFHMQHFSCWLVLVTIPFVLVCCRNPDKIPSFATIFTRTLTCPSILCFCPVSTLESLTRLKMSGARRHINLAAPVRADQLPSLLLI